MHIYEARAILIIFCDHRDTKSKLCEIDMSISQPILSHKSISNVLWDKDICTLQYRRNYL